MIFMRSEKCWIYKSSDSQLTLIGPQYFYGVDRSGAIRGEKCRDRIHVSLCRRFYVERRESIGSAEAARVAGIADAASAISIMMITATK